MASREGLASPESVEERTLEALRALIRVVDRLRGEGGCPWDRAQTHRSLLPYLVEETYEVVEAMEVGSPAQQRDELGDLLFQVLLHARIAQEAQEARDDRHYDLADVAEAIRGKMVRRHPHVFAENGGDREEPGGTDGPPPLPSPAGSAAPSPGSNAFWEARKARERADDSSVLDGIPPALPALLHTHRAGEKASRVGFDWPHLQAVLGKVHEELAELAEAVDQADPVEIRREYGDLLMSVAQVGRFVGVGPEEALRAANRRFERRFRALERLARRRGISIQEAPQPELEQLWRDVKKMESAAKSRSPSPRFVSEPEE